MLYPDSTNLRLQKASFDIRLEQWQNAKDEYDYILGHEPLNIPALFYRAYVNEKMNRYGFARQDYENLLTVIPGNFEAQLGLALLNQKDRHYTEAMDQINLLIEQYPDNAIAYAARAGMEQERNMMSLAEYDFSKAIELDSKNTDYILNRADIRIIIKKYAEAKRDLDLLVKMGVPRASLTEFYKRLKK